MSLPDGVTTCLVTYGPITNTLGTPADSISVSIVADRTIVHGASGRTLFKNTETFVADVGGTVQIPVPHVDQAGFRDQQQNALTNWYYTLVLTARFPNGGQETDRKTFQPLVGQTVVDADLLPSDGMVTPGVTTPTGVVTSVQGLTGAVDLSATFVPRPEDAGTEGQALVLGPDDEIVWGAGGGGGGYEPPEGGIPRTDLATAVQTSLAKADASVFRGGELDLLPVNEANLPVPVAQYDADTISGSDGSAVSSWADDTGTTGALVQATSGNQPRLKLNQINGHQAVRFSGGNYFLSVARTLTADFTIVFVGKGTNPGGYTVAIGDYLNSYAGLICGPGQNVNNSATPAVVGYAVYRLTVKAGLFTLYRNGVAVSSGSASNMTTLYVGRDSGANFYSDWDITHIRIYSGNLVPEDGVNIDSLIGRRYGIRVGTGSTSTRTRINTNISGQNVMLSLPENRTGQPLPLLVVNHGGGGGAGVAYDYPGMAASTDSALALGFAVLSADLHGDSAGNATQLQDQRDALTWALTQTPVSRIVLAGLSLGALPTLNAIRKGTYDSFGIPVVGALLIYPVVDIINGFYSIGHSQLIAAYGLVNTTIQATVASGVTSLSLGVSYASGTKLIVDQGGQQETVTVTGTPTGSGPYATPVTATTKSHNSGVVVSDAGTKIRDAGYDPSSALASAFGNKRYRVYASDADGAVSTAVNASPFLAKIAGTAREATLVKTRGGHGDPSNFNGRDQAQFLLRCLNDPGIV